MQQTLCSLWICQIDSSTTSKLNHFILNPYKQRSTFQSLHPLAREKLTKNSRLNKILLASSIFYFCSALSDINYLFPSFYYYYTRIKNLRVDAPAYQIFIITRLDELDRHGGVAHVALILAPIYYSSFPTLHMH